MAERVVIDTLGKDKLSKMRKVMPGEDFAWYLQDKPGALPLLGFRTLKSRLRTIIIIIDSIWMTPYYLRHQPYMQEYAIAWLKEHK